jgi:GxxExxY protein
MPSPIPPSEQLDAIAREIVDSAFKVHEALGPGLPESVYETCLCHELRKRGLAVRQQVPVQIIYDGVRLDDGLRLDLVVAGEVIVELKVVDKLMPVNEAQILCQPQIVAKATGVSCQFQCAEDQGRYSVLRALNSWCLGVFLVHRRRGIHSEGEGP